MASVIINPINPEFYKNSNLEPQYVTTRTPSRAIIYLDSADNPLQKNKTNLIMSTQRTETDSQNNLAYGISRISVDSVNITYVTPNVNALNNTVIFRSSNTGLTNHTVILTEKFYTNTNDLITEIKNKMQAISGVTGLTFGFTSITSAPDTYNLTSGGGSYYFVNIPENTSLKAQATYGFPTDQNFTFNKTVGYMSLYYTKWIDVCSTIINKYAKVRSISNGVNSNIVVRMFLDDPISPHEFTYFTVPNVSYTFIGNEPINYIDFQLRDMYGNLLYISPVDHGFQWGINLTIEA